MLEILIAKHEDKEFVAFYEGYKDLDDADKEILKATLDAFVRARRGINNMGIIIGFFILFLLVV